jgi:hypothetical protein
MLFHARIRLCVSSVLSSDSLMFLIIYIYIYIYILGGSSVAGWFFLKFVSYVMSLILFHWFIML